MLNITTGALPVTVAANSVVPFSITRVKSNRADRACNCRCGWFSHNEGSGQVELVNNSCQSRVFEVEFNANVASPSSGSTTAVTAVSMAIMLNGEAIGGTEMDYSAASDVYGNISAATLVQVPCGASVTVSVANVGSGQVLVKDGNFIVTRIA